MGTREKATAALVVPGALVAAGLALRLFSASRSIEELLWTTLPDDAFYYFGIARHLSLGHPPSIDGVNPTNGYHPLWMAVLVPLYLFYGAAEVTKPVHAALFLGALLDTASAVVLYRICRRAGLSWVAGSVSLFLFCLSPHEVKNATCGLETSLSLLLGLVTYLTYRRDEDLGRRRPSRLGLLAGLSILARTDQAILVGCLVADGALRAYRASGRRRAVAWSIEVLLSTLAVFAPWAIYSLYTTGTIVQSSAVALPFIHRQMPTIWGISQPTFGLALERALASVREAAVEICDWNGLSGAVALALAFLATLSGMRSPPPLRARLGGTLGKLAPLWVAAAAAFVAHTLVRSVFREWYTAPYIALFAILAGMLVDHALAWVKRPVVVWAFTAALLAAWSVHARGDWQAPSYRQTMAGEPSAYVREGHSDCGVMSYYTQQGITNLDGIVNQRALEAMLGGRLFEYIRAQRFNRVFLSDYYHSSVFLGRRYREWIVTDDGSKLGFRVIRSPIEKDIRIGPTEAPVQLGDADGREYLGDGFRWNPEKRPAAESLGKEAEFSIYLPRVGPGVTLALTLAAAAVDASGAQPVSVSLNDDPVASFRVPRAPTEYSIPLDRAVHGRNRVQLRFGSPQAKRKDSPAWWRQLDGNPVVAVNATTLWLNDTARRSASWPLAGPDSVPCDGCYGVEKTPHRHFRWTRGSAKVVLPDVDIGIQDAPECHLAVTAWAPHPYAVRWNGTELVGAVGSYVVPLGLREKPGPAEIEIVARGFVPAARGDSKDTRELGIQLERLEVACWGKGP